MKAHDSSFVVRSVVLVGLGILLMVFSECLRCVFVWVLGLFGLSLFGSGVCWCVFVFVWGLLVCFLLLDMGFVNSLLLDIDMDIGLFFF